MEQHVPVADADVDAGAGPASDDEDCEVSRLASRHNAPRRRTAPAGVVSHLFALPDTFTELRSHFFQFGFLDYATPAGFLAALRPHVTIVAKKPGFKHARRRAPRRAVPGNEPASLS